MANPYETGLDKNPANYQPLTPLVFLERAASVHPHHTAIIHGRTRTSYADFYARTRRLASQLAARGLGFGDTVAVMLANTPADAGGPLRRADDRRRAATAQHPARCGGDRLHARSWRGQGADHRPRIRGASIKETLKLAKVKPLVDRLRRLRISAGAASGWAISTTSVSSRDGDPDFAWSMPRDEWDAISLNYTSGTTGNPKGVVFHHRGAALMGYGNMLAASMPPASDLSVDACRCSTATAGAFPGRCRSSPARMCACAGCAPRRCTTRSPSTK